MDLGEIRRHSTELLGNMYRNRLTVAGVLRIVEHPGSQAVEYKAEPSVYWDLGHELLKELRVARSAPG